MHLIIDELTTVGIKIFSLIANLCMNSTLQYYPQSQQYSQYYNKAVVLPIRLNYFVHSRSG